MRSRAAIALLAALAAGLGSAAAQPIDVRDCPLDTVVFVDPWAGASFTVKKVGTDYNFICQDGFEPPDEMCSGPFGYLVLEGEHRPDRNAAPEVKTAVYSVIKAAPCCDWSVETGRTVILENENFKWLAEAEVPRLRDLPFLSIESQYGEDFGNPYFAAACTLKE